MASDWPLYELYLSVARKLYNEWKRSSPVWSSIKMPLRRRRLCRIGPVIFKKDPQPLTDHYLQANWPQSWPSDQGDTIRPHASLSKGHRPIWTLSSPKKSLVRIQDICMKVERHSSQNNNMHSGQGIEHSLQRIPWPEFLERTLKRGLQSLIPPVKMGAIASTWKL